MNRTSTRLWAASLIGLALVLTFGSLLWGNVDTERCRQELIDAAASAGISIDTVHMMTVDRDGVTFTGAVISGFEQIPATELPNGVDFGFAFVDLPGIPADYYILRGFADVHDIGQTPATVQFVSRDGDVVAESDGFVEVESLTVPDQPLFANSVITGELELDGEGLLFFRNYYICSNGWLICHGRAVLRIFTPRE